MLEILEIALRQGYLLHGSPHLINGCLDPNWAKDDYAQVGTMAIYATNILEVAVFRAVIRGDSIRWGYAWREGRLALHAENVLPEDHEYVLNTSVELGKGYIYILPRDSYEPSGDDPSEYASHTPVQPIQTIEVTPEELYKLQKEIGFTLDIR